MTNTFIPTSQTLTEALDILGITHEPSQIAGKRDWYTRSGEYLGAHDATEGWAYLKKLMKLAGRN